MRARATCVQSGITRFGQSELFTVPLNGSVTLTPIIFGPINPIPAQLTLTATPQSLTTVGATAQVNVVATYPNATTDNVTSSSKGTNYTTSNPAVATVSSEGVVSAVRNGTVIITAFNEGTSGFTQITVGIPPQISITAPANGSTVTQGASVPITAQIQGGATVLSVSFSINGRIEFTTTTAPYIYNFNVPTGAPSFTLGATVRDSVGASASAQSVLILAVPDPLTTVTGTVVDPSNSPVSGATVNCLGITGISGPSGAFSIPGVPTARGSIVCFASIVAGPITLTGSSAAVNPVLSGTTAAGQIKLSSLSSRGTDFWLGFQNYPFGSGAQLFILTETSANFTVSGTGFSVNGSVTASTPATVAIPNSFQIFTNQTIESKGIHLTSDAPITATFFYPQAFTNDTYLAIPTALLGMEYLAATYVGGPAEFVILGTQNNTTVTIIPACVSNSGTQIGTTLTISLNQGQTYQYLCGGDATGSQITSNKPIGVIAGNGCINIGSSACDILSEMMFPVGSLYGTDLFTAPFPGNSTDLIRVMASQDNTAITINDGSASPLTFTLNRGKFRELRTKQPSRYTSDKPITVVQFFADALLAGVGGILGDPLSMQILPTNAFRSSARVYSPSGFSQGNFLMIIAPTAAIATVAVNGVSVSGFKPMPGGNYQYAIVPTVTAQSIVTANQPIGVYAMGFTGAGSYGHPTTF